MKRFWFVIVLVLSLVVPGWTADYYFDAINGNDSTGNGTVGNPWRVAVNTKLGSGLSPGDNVYLARGTNAIYSERFVNYDNGSSGSPIKFAAYGTGDKPKLCAATVINSGDWTDDGGGKYHVGSITGNCSILLEDFIGIDRASTSALTDGNWYFDADADTIYYKPTSGTPASHDVRFIDSASGNTVWFSAYQAGNYLTFENLEFIGNNLSWVADNDDKKPLHVIIDSCDFKYTPCNALHFEVVGSDPNVRLGEYITVKDCTFTCCLNNMYFIGQNWGGFENVILQRNTITYSNQMGGTNHVSWDWSGGGDRDGVSIQNFRDCIIENNDISGLCHLGGALTLWIDTAFLGTGNVIRNNYIHNVKGGGILWGGSDVGHCNAQIYNNIIYRSGLTTETLSSWSDVSAWNTIWTAESQTGISTWNYDWYQNYNFRAVISSGSITSDVSKIKIRVEPSTTTEVHISSMYIGEKKSSSDSFDFNSSPTQITYGSSGSFIIDINSGLSDEITFSIDNTKDYLVSYFVSNNARPSQLVPGSGTNRYIKSGSDESSTQDVTGYTDEAKTSSVQAIYGETVYANSKKSSISSLVYDVTEDGTSLTKKTSIALVDANAGSWYWDGTYLYVRATSGLPGSNGKAYIAKIVYSNPGGTNGGISLNRVQDNDPASTVYNNTVVGCNINYYIGFGDYFILKNNISVDPVQYHCVAFDGLNDNIFGNNCWYPSTSNFSISSVDKTSAEWLAATGESNSITTNPTFVGSLSIAADFKLKSGSPAAKAGVDVDLSTDFAGNPWKNPPSMGAYQYFSALEQLLWRRKK